MNLKDSEEGEPGLKSICSDRGLPTSGKKAELVHRLKEDDAGQLGMTVDELYPITMLNDLLGQSEIDLDISKVTDSGYLIS